MVFDKNFCDGDDLWEDLNMVAKLDRYSIVHEPAGATYRGLLAFCKLVGDTVFLVVRDPDDIAQPNQVVLRTLEPFFLSAADENRWPGTKLDGHNTARVFRYRFTDQCREVLCTSANRLYEWRAWTHPENLCILRKETPLLTTIAHERTGFLDLSSDEYSRLQREVDGLTLFLGDFMPDSRELYRLFGRYLSDLSLERGATVDSALAAYVENPHVSAEQLNEAVASIVAAVSDLKDDAILRVVIERFGGGQALLREGTPTSVLLRIADQIESLISCWNDSN